jgi:hypothetical protein
MATLTEKHDIESETVTSEGEVQAKQSKGLCGMSRAMILFVAVLIAIIIGLSVAYATDIDPSTLVVENCVNQTDFGVVAESTGGDVAVGNGDGRDMQYYYCLGGVRTASRSSLSSAKAACYNQFYTSGCYYPYTLYSYKLRYAGWIVNCACNC